MYVRPFYRLLIHASRKVKKVLQCDSPKPGGPLTNYQPAKNLWMSGNPIPHCCVPFTGTHNLTKIGQTLICTGSSSKNTTYRTYNNMTHPGLNITQ